MRTVMARNVGRVEMRLAKGSAPVYTLASESLSAAYTFRERSLATAYNLLRDTRPFTKAD